jgi:SNF2 family DNA or RNA helicase
MPPPFLLSLSRYILRRLKEDVEKSVPPKEETLIEVELTLAQKQYYRALYEKNVQVREDTLDVKCRSWFDNDDMFPSVLGTCSQLTKMSSFSIHARFDTLRSSFTKTRKRH